MTSSDCLSSSNRYRPRLSNVSRLTLPIPSIHHITDDPKRAVSPSPSSVTPTSTSPNMYFTPIGSLQHRFPHPNRFPFARPPTLPLGRRGIEFKPPEQDVLDKSFFRAFNMEQNNETSGKTSETIRTSQGRCRTSERTNKSIFALHFSDSTPFDIDAHNARSSQFNRHGHGTSFIWITLGKCFRTVRSTERVESTAFMAIEFEWSRNRTRGQHSTFRHTDARNATCISRFNIDASSSLSVSDKITLEVDDVSRDKTIQPTSSTHSEWKSVQTGTHCCADHCALLFYKLLYLTFCRSAYSALLRRTRQYGIIDWMNVKAIKLYFVQQKRIVLCLEPCRWDFLL